MNIYWMNRKIYWFRIKMIIKFQKQIYIWKINIDLNKHKINFYNKLENLMMLRVFLIVYLNLLKMKNLFNRIILKIRFILLIIINYLIREAFL